MSPPKNRDFLYWVIRRFYLDLFPPFVDQEYSFEAQMFVFFTELHQSYETFMQMEINERLMLVRMVKAVNTSDSGQL